MKLHRGFPWAVVVLSTTARAWSQATVTEGPAATPMPVPTASNQSGPNIRAAAREGRSISLSDESIPVGSNISSSDVPEFHTVERGDTLWDITGQYFQNPWRWPGVWGLNPQITNPHWIFPGDRVRLLAEGLANNSPRTSHATQTISAANSTNAPGPSVRVAPQTVFLREQGWVDESDRTAAGTVVGSPDDEMLLSEGNRAYIEFRNRTPHVGEQYTIYQDAQSTSGGDRAHGRVVRILGTAVVESWDANQHLATARIAESLDTIERGERVAAIPRHLDVVPPRTNSVDLRTTIVAAVHPRELLGQNMVVFFDRGSDDHVEPGNRLFVMRQGDALVRSIQSNASNVWGSGIDRDGDGNTDDPPGHIRAQRQLPREVVGELLVLDVRPHSSTAIVTSSVVEVEVGDLLEMRRGY